MQHAKFPDHRTSGLGKIFEGFCHEKTNILVSDLVRNKPGCKATEDG